MDPIQSYGIILFYNHRNGPKFLLAQRRDTIEYVEFLRGGCTTDNLETYISLMSQEERDRLQQYSFSELWDDLWVNHNSRFFWEAQNKAKTKHAAIWPKAQQLIQKTTSSIKEPSWGFPKGKPHTYETDLECAFREFKEETRINIGYTELLNIPPVKELFLGSNGKPYSTLYYFAKVDYQLPISKFSINGIRKETVSEEISNLQWCTFEEALSRLNPIRQELLHTAVKRIAEYNSNKC
jgi:8-oxo-dGTP pyrophosphatase MutT (NUDIX family)